MKCLSNLINFSGNGRRHLPVPGPDCLDGQGDGRRPSDRQTTSNHFGQLNQVKDGLF